MTAFGLLHPLKSEITVASNRGAKVERIVFDLVKCQISLKYYTFAPERRDAGVVERGGLENRCARKGTGGSNPFLSAKQQKSSCESVGIFYLPGIVESLLS